MPSARSAILISVAVLLISLAAATLSLLGPPDSGGFGRDSYGTRWNGMRALFELLNESGVRVQRNLHPPAAGSPQETYLLWMPDEDLAAVEPAYLEHLRDWVRRGGRVVVVPAPGNDGEFRLPRKSDKQATFRHVLETLGVAGIDVRQAKAAQPAPSSRERIGRGIERTWKDVRDRRETATHDVGVTPSGVFAQAPLPVRRLHLPSEELQQLTVSDDVEFAGTIGLDLPDEPIAVAAVSLGAGEVIVVADGYLFMNAGLAQADNAALAYDLLAGGGRAVTIDEFYHGLAVRGNALWLLTQPVYAAAVFSCLIVAGLLLWRRAIPLGEPPEPLPKSRRSVLEYVEATAHFFNRSRGAPQFVLAEVRAGALHVLSERWRVRDGEASVEKIAAAMSRRAPAEAQQFRRAMASIDAAEAFGSGCSAHQVVEALQGITHCLSPNSTK